MPAVVGAPDFEAALGDLQDHLPLWWRTQDPSSNLYAILNAAGAQLDGLAVLFEQSYLDQDLDTASLQGLLRNFAFAWGVAHEQLPTTLPQLASYLSARVSEDGSLLGLVNTLTTFLATDANTAVGHLLKFPTGGQGLAFPDPSGGNLVFPMTGGLTLPATFGSQLAGLVMWEFTAGNAPSTGIGLVFPKNGKGLRFPQFPETVASDNVIVQDGSTPVGAGPGLTFASNQFVQVIPNFVTSTMTVEPQSWCTFDRGAFARAVARAQPMDWYPTVIVETTNYH